MTSSARSDPPSMAQDVALVVGGGPGISSSCARLFAHSGMRVAIAARNPDKPVLLDLEKSNGVRRRSAQGRKPAVASVDHPHEGSLPALIGIA